jgi:hypothetical protein
MSLTGMGLTGGCCCGGQEFNRLFMQKIEECFASFGDDIFHIPAL